MPETLIKAVTCNIPLGDSVLDAYMLPNDEKYLGIENIGFALGYPSTKTFFQRINPELKSGQFLKKQGFSGEQTWVSVIHINETSGITDLPKKVISVKDFIKLITYEGIINKNKKAIVLLAAFAETGMDKILEDAFAGRSIDFILDKIVHYSKWTYEQLEEVLAYNREEVKALYPWGFV